MKLVKIGVQGFFRAFGFELSNLRNTWGVTFWNDLRLLSAGRDISTIFDVGANIGTTARLFSRRFPKARIHAFEPVPNTYKLLTQNTLGMQGINCVNVGFGDKTETKEIYLFKNSEVSTVVRNSPYATKMLRSEPLGTTTINLLTIDEFAAQNKIDKIQVLKIDTEGFELQVLKGSDGLLRRNGITFIYCEFNDLFPASGLSGGALSDIHELLSSRDFKLAGMYVDYIKPDKEFFAVRNALYVNTVSYEDILLSK